MKRASTAVFRIIVAGLLGLFAFELGARLIRRPEPAAAYALAREPSGPEASGQLYQFDPWLGWRHRPNAQGHLRASDFACDIRIDEEGRRSVPRAANPSGRVAIFGDSVAFGHGVSDEQTFAARLAAARPDLAVENHAVSGYGTDQQLLSMRARRARLGGGIPTVWLVTFYLNDLSDISASNRFGYAKPQFALREADALYVAAPIPALDPIDARPEQLDDWQAPTLAGPSVTNLMVRLGALPAREAVDDYLGYFLRARADERAEGWRLWAALMDQIHQEARAARAELVVLLSPVRTQVVESERQKLERLFGYQEADLDLDEPERKVSEWAARAGVRVILPRARLQQEAAAGRSPYFAFDLHPNAHGHAILGELLAETILR